MTKNYLFTAILLIVILISSNIFSQINEGGVPISIATNSNNFIPVYNLPETPVDDLIAEDIQRDSEKSLPYRFGYNHYVALNLHNSGTWTTLANGSKLWQLAIYSEDAKSINITFDKYHLPEGAKLFIYSSDKKEIIGAFTKRNNQQDQKLGCTLVHGEMSILEYYEPANAEFTGQLQLWRVTHGYRSLQNYAIKAYGDAGSCNNNVNCPIGGAWQDQKRSVACIVVGGNESCTGAMVNDVPQDGTPYFLTANHCTDGTESTWVFRFNWESATCLNANGPTNQTVSGSAVKAKNANSDVALLQLNSVPPSSYNIYYSGWSNLDVPADSTVCIHHPSGDIKKISFAPGATSSSVYSSAMCWKTAQWFDGLLNGATEPGSSGSPLFDMQHRIIGQLYGGPSNCSSPAGQRHDFYGKFSSSWDSGATAATRLKDWLDPQNTGATTINGMNAVPPVANNTGIAGVVSPNSSFTSCDLNITPEVTLFNYGNNTITSVTITYSIDGGANNTYNWSGSLAPGSSQIVLLPNVLLSNAGAHTITVSTSMPNGLPDGNTTNDSNTSSFSITDPNQSVSIPFVEDFTMQTFPNNGWRVLNPDNNTTWAFQTSFTVSNAPGSSGKSLRYRNKPAGGSTLVAGQLDYAITPFYNFTGQGSPLNLYFYHAYAKYNNSNDSLIISFTKDCGISWTRLKGFSADDLALNSGGNTTSNTSFIPSADSMWVRDSIDISAVAGLSGIQFAFINRTDLGNSLFIDRININDNPVGINESNNLYQISIFPNPANSEINFSANNSDNYQLNLFNVLGENVYSGRFTASTKISTNKFSKGIYIVEINYKNNKINKRIVIN